MRSKCRVYTKSNTYGFRIGSYTDEFWDEDGRYHAHPNSIADGSYSCTNNHKWEFLKPRSCWCGFSSEEVDGLGYREIHEPQYNGNDFMWHLPLRGL